VQFLAVRFEKETAFVVIKLVVDELLVGGQLDDELLTPSVLGAEGVRDRSRVVIRQG
jgi:hypothetical protein